MIYRTNLILTLCFFILQVVAQEKPDSAIPFGGEYSIPRSDSKSPCVPPAQYKSIEEEINKNCKELKIETSLKKGAMVTSFAWPLKASSAFHDCGYYLISNYVDQDLTTAIKDYSCGAVTYDGHQGTDIAAYPYSFYKMDHDQVEIIAAAAGTIVTKVNGNADKNCAMNSTLTPNYVAIAHADGSRALYLHMKMNSLTTKTVGQTVAVGEFLGLVGSSGSSTGPHLHFEVWSTSSASSMIDPYSGSCNSLNSSTWWTSQKPYTEPAILAAQVNTVLAQFPACPATEIPNDVDCVNPSVQAYFYIFLRNESVGLSKNLKILGPNNTTFQTWSSVSANSYLGSYWYWNYTTPSVPGTYTFEASYNGQTCSKVFQVGCTTVGVGAYKNSPVNLQVLTTQEEIQLNYEGFENAATHVSLTGLNGQTIFKDSFIQDASPFKRSLRTSQIENGVYFLSSETSHGRIVKKIIIQHE